jgi:hypothetical protein
VREGDPAGKSKKRWEILDSLPSDRGAILAGNDKRAPLHLSG